MPTSFVALSKICIFQTVENPYFSVFPHNVRIFVLMLLISFLSVLGSEATGHSQANDAKKAERGC